MAKRVLPQVQAEEMGFLQGVHGVKFRDKVYSCGIGKTLNAEPLFLGTEIPATMVRPRNQNARERLERRVLLATPTGKRPRVDHGTGVITSPTWCGPVLV